jgi:hypothetical protein
MISEEAKYKIAFMSMPELLWNLARCMEFRAWYAIAQHWLSEEALAEEEGKIYS